MFTKFGFRIQRVLYALIRKNPASVLFQSYLFGLMKMPTVFDSFMPANFNNPLRIGALQGFEVWDEPFPIKILHNMIK